MDQKVRRPYDGSFMMTDWRPASKRCKRECLEWWEPVTEAKWKENNATNKRRKCGKAKSDTEEYNITDHVWTDNTDRRKWTKGQSYQRTLNNPVYHYVTAHGLPWA